jgi:hypothetical protein
MVPLGATKLAASSKAMVFHSGLLASFRLPAKSEARRLRSLT